MIKRHGRVPDGCHINQMTTGHALPSNILVEFDAFPSCWHIRKHNSFDISLSCYPIHTRLPQVVYDPAGDVTCPGCHLDGWMPRFNRTLAGNLIVDHSEVVGASPVGAAPTTWLHLHSPLNNCKPKRDTFKFWNVLRLILEILRYYHTVMLVLVFLKSYT